MASVGQAGRAPSGIADQVTARLRPAAPAQPPAYTQELDVPEGATDLFHVVHLSRPLVSEWLSSAGLAITAADRHGASVFIQAAPL